MMSISKFFGRLASAAKRKADKYGKTEVQEGDGFVLHQYPDYETYRHVQETGNKAKLGNQFVKESHISFLAEYLNTVLGKVDFGLCHGVRRGSEQQWFRSSLVGEAEVIGTDISETASDFANTVQWDFHELNPEWSNRADFVYSNSWDHAYDPHKAFASWFDALRPGGMILLDHTTAHLPKATSALDPFGATEATLTRMLAEVAGLSGRVEAPLDRRTDPDYPCMVLVCRKNS
jgi:SAM-dependent methyltransferase